MDLENAMTAGEHLEVVSIAEHLLVDGSEERSQNILRKTKLIALIKAEQYKQALTHYNSNQDQMKDSYYKFLGSYLLYKNEKFLEAQQKLQELIVLELPQKMLKYQIENKLEKFENAFSGFYELYFELESDKDGIKEEILVNLLNSLILLFLSSITINGSEILYKISQVVQIVTSTDYQNYELSETLINIVLLFVVIENSSIPEISSQMRIDEFDIKTNALLSQIEKMLPQGTMNGELTEAIQSPEALSDRLTLVSLKALIKQKKQKIEWNTEEVDELFKLVSGGSQKVKNQQLRVSVLSFLCFIQSVVSLTEENNDKPLKLMELLQKEEAIMVDNSKLSRYLRQVINFNRTVLFLKMKRISDARRVFQSIESEVSLSSQFLPLKFALLISTSKFQEFNSTLNTLRSKAVTAHQQCVCFLLELAFYHQFNNSRQYIECFNRFLDKLFVPQLNLDSNQRFLSPKPFAQFAKSIVFYVLKNKALVTGLREKLVEFVEYIDNSETIVQLSEGCIARGEYKVAEKLICKLLKHDPNNLRLKSRLNYVYSVLDPSRIELSSLPDFPKVADVNKLRSLENDYMSFIKQKENNCKGKEVINTVGALVGLKKEEVNIQPIIMKKKKNKKDRKIRWPKNFNFENPGPRPDEERWLPKMERRKYRKIAIKKGYLSRTQGGTTVNAEKTTELFKAENSTANKTTGSSKLKKKRK